MAARGKGLVLQALSSRRFVARHFPERIPLTEKNVKSQKRCTVCYDNGIRKQTSPGVTNYPLPLPVRDPIISSDAVRRR